MINTSTNKVAATITTGAAPIGPPTGVAVKPDGKHVYVTNESTPIGTVADIKAPTNKVVATIPVGDEPVGLAFTPDGKRAFVANFNSNNVSVIDTSTKKVVATIGVGTHPSGVGIVMTRRAARRRVPRHK